VVARGEQAGLAKLTDDAVREIRRRYAEGGISQQQLANEYSVHQTKISAVVTRKTWRHVE
jgi:predicted transcriptional regulator